MWKFPDAAAAARLAVVVLAVVVLAVAALAGPAWAAGDAARGERVFKKCAACHAVGADAGNRVGPHLNDLFGRAAGGLEDFRYSKAMAAAGEGGTVWDAESLAKFLEKPRDFVKGTKMSFAGLRKAGEREDVIAYLRGFSGAETAAPASERETPPAPQQPVVKQQAAVQAPPAGDRPRPDHGVYHLGRRATAEEIAAWDIDVRPDGRGLPEGRGTVAEGEALYSEACAVCHGDFGEGRGRWPVLAGGFDSLKAERPVKTIGSYWPYLSTVYDYVRRAMPFGNARSLSDDEVYAITAYLLYLNDVVTDEDFELSQENFTTLRLPNEENFFMDDRRQEVHYADKGDPCMTDCKPGPAKITMRARVLDVTPDTADEEAGQGGVD